MVANVIIVAALVAGVFLSVRSLVREQRAAKKSGVPAGCCGCAAYKNGACPSHNGCGK